MRILTILAVTIAAIGCAKQTATPAVSATQPVAIDIGTNTRSNLQVKDVDVSPQTLKSGQQARLTVHLDSTDPKALVRVNWFDPSGWSVFESKQPASSEELTFTVPSKLFRDAGRYRAEVRTGDVYQGEATLDVTG